ncbi:MAG: capsular biosynthesis protein [Pseudomonadota bacterium]
MTALWACWPPATARLVALQACLDAQLAAAPWRWKQASALACWQPNGGNAAARRMAAALGLPLLQFAPGHVALDPGAPQPISLVPVDAARFEVLAGAVRTQAPAAQAQHLMRELVAQRISHHSAAPLVLPPELPRVKTARRVLAAVGGADAAAARRMLQAAIADNPGSEVWAYAPGATALPDRGIRQISTPCNSYLLLEQFDAVCTVDSIIGFEALLAGLPVRVHGSPFYAGRGLTQDDAPLQRGEAATLAEVFDAAYLQHCRYLDPVTHGRGTLADAMDIIMLQRSVRRRYTSLGPLAAQGFSRWKRPFVRPFLEAAGEPVRWRVDGRLRPVLWGAAAAPATANAPARMEDGFLRSAGLGSDLAPPHSMVLDSKGIYFNPHEPGELADLLAAPETGEAALARAENLRRLICGLHLSKYNFGPVQPAWTAPPGRTVVLVPGQVRDDASVRLGAAGIGTMEELLARVRQLRPDAFVVYKPHPDVMSGNRKGLVRAQTLCDIVDAHADLVSLIECADEVHTLSSLAGFEALLRQKRVFTYGNPFYVGWGLTHDWVNNIADPRSAISLQQLIDAVLIRYPLYWDWKLSLFTTPEATAHALARQLATKQEKLLPHTSPIVRQLAKATRWLRNVLAG